MYRKILVALENSRADESLLPHVAELAKQFQSHVLLVHVADGWAARHFNQLKLIESEEMRDDREYLERSAAQLRAEGIVVSVYLAMGEPSQEILRTADAEECDLIAMTTHGHRWLQDLMFGSTISAVRHKAEVPILLVKASKK
jgi:nucleotide-binding universal stress UspA family protein